MGSAKRAVKAFDFDLHGSPYTHTKANVALNTIFLVLSIEQNGPLCDESHMQYNGLGDEGK